MKGFFALCDTSVRGASEALRRGGVKCGVVYADTSLDGLQVALVVSTGKFMNRAREFLDWGGVVIVFDAPVRCDHLQGITMLDVKERTESFRYVFDRISDQFLLDKVQEALEADEDVGFTYRRSNMMSFLLAQTSNSQMDRVQTWKYTIRDPALRDEALHVLVSWFFNPKPTLEALRNRLAKLVTVPGKETPKALESLFTGTTFPALKEAILKVEAAKAAGKAVSVDKVAEQHSVSAFDMRYLISLRAKILSASTHDPGVPLEDVHRAARNKQPCPLKGEEDGES